MAIAEFKKDNEERNTYLFVKISIQRQSKINGKLSNDRVLALEKIEFPMMGIRFVEIEFGKEHIGEVYKLINQN